jgi:hypothetical protein
MCVRLDHECILIIAELYTVIFQMSLRPYCSIELEEQPTVSGVKSRANRTVIYLEVELV